MQIKVFDRNTDYEIAETLWKQRNHDIIPKEFLSDFGVMAYDESGPAGIMWFYPVMSANWGMIRFPITNKEISDDKRNEALNLIFDTIHETAKSFGYKYIFCATNHKGLIKRLEKYGYNQDSKDCVMFWGGL